MTRRHSGLVLLSLLTCVSIAWACAWDRDTLRQEAAGLPGVVDVITGNFDRFPPSYYEARLERVAPKLEDATPSIEALALYDDAGVACDRLGRGDEAIAWMAKKRAMLDAMASEDTGEHEYRYLANLGTFHAHKWFRAGGPRETEADLADLVRGRDLIAAAIELNPDAHFGREWMQLQLLELSRRAARSDGADPSEPWAPIAEEIMEADDYFPRATEALQGLIVMGAAWGSPEIFELLAAMLAGQRHSSIHELATLRADELRARGRGLDLWSVQGLYSAYGTIRPWGEPEDVGPYFRQARRYADARHAARVAYVDEQVAAGRHPDTHADFWDDFAFSERPPKMPNGIFGYHRYNVGEIGSPAALLVAAAAMLLAIVLSIRRLRRVKLEAAA